MSVNIKDAHSFLKAAVLGLGMAMVGGAVAAEQTNADGKQANPPMFLVAGEGESGPPPVLVAPGGQDTVDCGAEAKPCATLGHALGRVRQVGTIELAAGNYPGHDVVVAKSVTIRGAGPESTVLDAGQKGRVLDIASGTKVLLHGLKIVNGSVAAVAGTSLEAPPEDAIGGGIRSAADLTIEDVTFFNNRAIGGAGVAGVNGSHGGHGGRGRNRHGEKDCQGKKGAAYNRCYRTAIGSPGGSGANGGAGGPGGRGGSAFGGALYSSGPLTIRGAVFHENIAAGGAGGPGGIGGNGGNGGVGGRSGWLLLKQKVGLIWAKYCFDRPGARGGGAGAGGSGGKGGKGGAAVGGAIYVDSRANVDVSISNVTFLRNQAKNGAKGAGQRGGGAGTPGGGGAGGKSPWGCVKGDNNDRSSGPSGRGASNGEKGALGQIGFAGGGGINILGGSRPTSLSNIVAVGNEARFGGAIAGDKNITLRHATLTANTAHHQGGGIYASTAKSDRFEIHNSAIWGNTGKGGKPAASVSENLGGTVQIVHRHWDAENSELPMAFGSCIEGYGGDQALANGNLDGCNPGIQVNDELWEDLANLMENVQTRLTPALGSPLINAGLLESVGPDVSGLAGARDAPLPVDAAGHARIYNYPFWVDGMAERTGIARTDIGAFEAYVDVQSWDIGKPVTAPDSAIDINSKRPFGPPRVEPKAAADTYYWDDIGGALYPVGEYQRSAVNLIWPTAPDADGKPRRPAFMHGRADWPEDAKVVAAGADLDLTPAEDASFRFVAIGNPKVPGASTEPVLSGLEAGSQRLVTFLEHQAADLSKATPVFKVIEARESAEFAQPGAACTVGQPILNPMHQDRQGRNGFVADPAARVDMGGAGAAYDRARRTGPIVPVNATDAEPARPIVVAWYRQGDDLGIYWPDSATHHRCAWPGETETITAGAVARAPMLSGDAATSAVVWHQPDSAKAGFNPNDEHAWLSNEDDGRRLFTLRWQQGERPGGAGRHVLIRTGDGSDALPWSYHIRRIAAPSGDALEPIRATAGQQLTRPVPLSLMDGPLCRQTAATGPVHIDRDHVLWAEAATPSDAPIGVDWWYPATAGMALDLNGDGKDDSTDGCFPWLAGSGSDADAPATARYDAKWPEDKSLTRLNVGQSLSLRGAGAVEIVHGQQISARLLSVSDELRWPLDAVPHGIRLDRKGWLTGLPGTLGARLRWDRQAKELILSGGLADAAAATAAPQFLINRIGRGEILAVRRMLDAKGIAAPDFFGAIEKLAEIAEAPERLARQKLTRAQTPVLSTGAMTGDGYITVALNDDVSSSEQVSLRVMKVSCPLYVTPVRVAASGAVFDPTTDLIHGADYGGDTDRVAYEWRYRALEPGSSSRRVLPDDMAGWGRFHGTADLTLPGAGAGVGMSGIRVPATSAMVLEDTGVLVRARGFTDVCGDTPGPWTGSTVDDGSGAVPAFMPGWAKGVVAQLNAIDPRQKDLSQAAESTVTSVIALAGPRYEGDLVLAEGEALASAGLIEAYQTLLNQVQGIVDGIDAPATPGQNEQMLFLSARIADLYRELADEAISDFSNPAVAVTDEVVGTAVMRTTSRFAFERQLPGRSRLEEELALLRGRDDLTDPVSEAPFYNRLRWALGTDAPDEALYIKTYGINRVLNFDDDKPESWEAFARAQYPQGHGDAWGHYMTATKQVYRMLRRPDFTWKAAADTAISAEGGSYSVSSSEEQVLADAAMGKAATGARIVDLTFRKTYRDRDIDRLLGYPGNGRTMGPEWAMLGWGQRAGQAVYFDWLTLNGVLPQPCGEDCQAGHRVDRRSLADVAALPMKFDEIQLSLNRAAAGLTPLGLPKDMVPFGLDIDKKNFGEKDGHFEQIYARAIEELELASAALESTEFLEHNLRRSRENQSGRLAEIAQREEDARRNLIRLYGRPYEDDLGRTYPFNYDGPDLYNYDIVDFDVAAFFGSDFEVTGAVGLRVKAVDQLAEAFRNPEDLITIAEQTEVDSEMLGDGSLIETAFDQVPGLTVGLDFLAQTDPLSAHQPPDFKTFGLNPGKRRAFENAEARYQKGERVLKFVYAPELGAMLKPEAFRGNRPENGEIQFARLAFLREYGQLRQNLQEYEVLRLQMIEQLARLDAKIDSHIAEQDLQEQTRAKVRAVQKNLLGIETVQVTAEAAAQMASESAQLAMNANPLGFAAVGFTAASFVSRGVATAASIRMNRLQVQREQIEMDTNFALLAGVGRKAEQLMEASPLFETALRERALRAAIQQQDLAVNEAQMRYLSLLSEGEREIDALVRFRREMAAETTSVRYSEALNRMLRREAVEAYNARFDAAARQAFLAAKAYQYETGGYGYHGNFNALLSNILSKRSLGAFDNANDPIAGKDNGLLGVMGELRDRFKVFKVNSGFLNAERPPALRLSLREGKYRFPGVVISTEQEAELAELLKDAEGNARLEQILRDDYVNELEVPQSEAYWHEILNDSYVADLRQVPEFNACCLSDWNRDQGPVPGLVFEFKTEVSAGKNLFGLDRAGRDPVTPYNAFANRIERVAVRLTGYQEDANGAHPQALLIPAGSDILRTLQDGKNQAWNVLDAKLPLMGERPATNHGLDVAKLPLRQMQAMTAYYDDNFVPEDLTAYSTRLFGRALENTRWLLVIPGEKVAVNGSAEEGLRTLIGSGDQMLQDIEVWFKIYSFAQP